MKTLSSYVVGGWHTADRDFQTLVDPSTEEPLARASSTGADLPGALAWARDTGSPALSELTFGQRGEALKCGVDIFCGLFIQSDVHSDEDVFGHDRFKRVP